MQESTTQEQNEALARIVWRERFETCRLVAEATAGTLAVSPLVTAVGLYGSVARGTEGNWTKDVDLAVFVDENLARSVWYHRRRAGKGREELLFQALFADSAETVVQLLAGNAADNRVPISLHILPATLNENVFSEFQRNQRDPLFLSNIMGDMLFWDAQQGQFASAPTPR